MASVVILLLVVVQFYCNSVLGSVLETSTECGGDQVEYLKAPDGFSFSLNGKRIEDPVLMCEVLELHFRSGCLVCDSGVQQWRRIGEKYCRPSFAAFGHCGSNDISLNIIKQVGRKLFLELPKDVSDLDQESERGQLEEETQEYKAFPESETIDFVVPSMFLLCCGILCPCFYAKRRELDDHNALSRQVNSLDSATSFDTSQMSVSEKFPATPRVPPSPSRFSLSPQLSTVGPVNLTFNQIIKATQSFSPSLKLGEGGFGTVYKAVLPDGQVVAIKRAKKEQVSQLRDEFSNEVELLSKIEHRNLVRLLGYTDKGSERIIITEYVPNGTLREHLDGQRGRILDFNQRLEIAIDVAHALTYLHQFAEKTIIHRDVKSSNILLTEAYRAKVSDFGFARSGPTDVEQTHISTKVKGTAGYLDPEYLRTYRLTPKSDVFSFGILLIEIVSGRRPVDLKRSNEEKITVRWAFKKHDEGNVRDVVDPLLDDYVQDEIFRMMLDLAFQCAAPTRVDRPSMEEAGKQLWEIRREYSKTRKGT